MTNVENETSNVYGYAMFLEAKLEPKISGKILNKDNEKEKTDND